MPPALLRDLNRSKQPVVFHVPAVCNARSEIQRIRISAIAAIAELQRPKPRDRDRIAITVTQRAKQFTREWIESMDRAVSKIPDEQSIAEVAEEIRRQFDSPRRVERAIGYQPLEQVSVEIEHIDEAVARASDVVMLVVVLHRVRYVELVPDPANIERRETRREVWIAEVARHRRGLKRRIEDVDRTGAEIRRVEQWAIASHRQREPFVNCSGRRSVHH